MITVTVDARQALAKLSPGGLTASVRNNLRRVVPDLTKRLGSAAEYRLDTGLKSRRSITVTKTMTENTRGLYGTVSAVTNTDRVPKFLPEILETGAEPHAIVARNAPALYFFWEKMGRFVSFKRVWHPGFEGIGYMEDAFASMEEEIRTSIESAVRAAATATNSSSR
jgi:hypothetical protein